MNKLLKITEPNEMKKFIEGKKYLLVDDEINEYIIMKSDLADYIFNRNEDINVYKPDGTFLLSTFGYFLNKIDYIDRQKIVDRLVKLQVGEIESRKTYFCDSIILNYM